MKNAKTSLVALTCTLCLVGAPLAEASPQAGGSPPGALVRTSMHGVVGVVLDEIPAGMRARVAADLLQEGAAFWHDRATRQVELTEFRLDYRHFVYNDGRRQLPLPPEEVWTITLDAAGASRALVGGHDVVKIGYQFSSLIVSDVASPATSDPALASIGGTVQEPFVLPLDPEMLFQRTGYACMDEADFPPNSVDSENAKNFYDQDCDVEGEGDYLCHTSATSPVESCIGALEAHVGKVVTAMSFTRLPWSEKLAAKARVSVVTQAAAPDLEPIQDRLHENRITYRYVEPDACAVAEGCVGGTGWRRLLQFDAAVHNVGGAPLVLGPVDYYLTGETSLNDLHHVFEYSACHEHYHFEHYGDFVLGTGAHGLGNKKAFCLLSSERLSNNEQTPLNTVYSACDYQGIEAGWGDDYQAGLECQWVDITDVDTAAGPATQPLTFVSNTDGFLCEGSPITDEQGEPLWEPTSFVSEAGEPVDRMQCEFAPGWDTNNVASIDVTVPQRGGLLTSPCAHPSLGPLRNCGFAGGGLRACVPGQTVSLLCSVADAGRPQVLRVCEASQKLGTGVACVEDDALSNVVVGGPTAVTLACPGARDADEPGGSVSVYTAPVYPPDGLQAVTCTQL